MKGWSSRLLLIAAVAGIVGCAAWREKFGKRVEPVPAPPEPVPAHVMLAPEAIKWQPFPAGGPGAKLAVLSGDPQKSAPFVIRIRQPAGAKIPPHWHPTEEHVTVIKGMLFLGMGEKAQKRAARAFSPGSYLLLPRKMPHFGWAGGKGETIVQVHGMGPFQIVYVNPADDPRSQPGKR